MDAGAPLLQVRDLRVVFDGPGGPLPAVDGAAFTLPAGQTLCLVGESGSGKSVTALAIVGLVPAPGRVVGGAILFHGINLLPLSPAMMRTLRGRRIAMVFQDPATSLDPLYPIGDQLLEAVRAHDGLPAREARDRVLMLLHRVGMPDPARRLRDYPHHLSGGMQQRVMIAMALMWDPELIIADEPTSALDVTIQAQILDVLRDLRARLPSALLLITHDMGVVAETADVVAVMYAGRIVETAPVRELFRSPRHPYTQGLLECVPRPGSRRRLRGIPDGPGGVPARGCPFAPRCPLAGDDCRVQAPPVVPVTRDHTAVCWRAA